MLSRIYDFLVKALGLSADLVSPERFAIRVYDWSKNPEPPEPLLLNSFFLNDLAQASGLFKTEKAPKNLKRFIGVDPPVNRKDLNRSLDEL